MFSPVSISKSYDRNKTKKTFFALLKITSNFQNNFPLFGGGYPNLRQGFLFWPRETAKTPAANPPNNGFCLICTRDRFQHRQWTQIVRKFFLKSCDIIRFIDRKSYILMHFQTRKEGKLARTRSQLYQKLRCRATAHFLQNGTRYNEKQRENTESTKKHCFGKPKTGAPRAPCLHTFSRISIDIRKTKEKRKLSNFKFSTHIVTDRAENWHTSTTPSGQ